jgi:DNA replication initiation complex subunit (GINS family)
MDEPTVDRLRRLLESEEGSETLNPLPPDTYVKLASYAQKLRVALDSNGDDISARLCRKQLWLMEAMTRRLLHLRLAKAETGASRNVLPEEEAIVDSRRELGRDEGRFVRAVVDGQPSYFTLAQRRQVQRIVTVRLLKPMGEIMGADLRRYGPFEVHDLARIPAGNAKPMIEGGQAALVSSPVPQE